MGKTSKSKKIKFALLALIYGISIFVLTKNDAEASSASLYLSPPLGTYSVGDTFDVSVYLNTGDNFINAVEAELRFPPGKLQVVTPSAGTSLINIWIGQPQYSNTNGSIVFRGAIPNPGVNVSRGLISTVTFRVRSVGKAVIEFSDSSKVLLNDGGGTDILSNTDGAVLDLVLPPPAGPIIVSSTHPNQSKWYAENSTEFSWTSRGPADAYSYVLNSEPLTVSDNISEGTQNEVIYQSVSDGTHYFHIKSIKDGVWGGTSHYAVNVDTTPPAQFKLVVEPKNITSEQTPVIYFATTDLYSGLSHYEIKILSLSNNGGKVALANGGNFFIETSSPYIPRLALGKYSVIVRAHDVADNVREVSGHIEVLTPIGSALSVARNIWLWLILLLIIVLLFVAYYAYRHWKEHRKIERARVMGGVNQEIIAEKIKELQELQEKYAKGVALVLLLFLLGSAHSAFAENSNPGLPSPVITTYSQAAASDEIFYVGGFEYTASSSVQIYVQNIRTGERYQFNTDTDEKGEWFYVHNDFLPSGNYELWVQAQIGDLSSAPSAKYSFVVEPTVIKFGGTRISLETIYLLVSVLLLLAIFALIIIARFHSRYATAKRAQLMREIRQMDESIKVGFAVLKNDIERELKIIHQMKLAGTIAKRELENEKIMMEDLEKVKHHIRDEIWEIRHIS